MHALYTLSAADSGRFLQNPREVAQIVGGQSEQSMQVKDQTLKKIRTLYVPEYLTVDTGHIDTYPNRFGYVSRRACVVFGRGSKEGRRGGHTRAGRVLARRRGGGAKYFFGGGISSHQVNTCICEGCVQVHPLGESFLLTVRLRSRPGKPNQRKGQNEKFIKFAHFCEFWCFSLGKQARFTLNFCSGMPLQKIHELTFLWFGLPGPLLIDFFLQLSFSACSPSKKSFSCKQKSSNCKLKKALTVSQEVPIASREAPKEQL